MDTSTDHLIEVHGNDRQLILIKGAINESQARRTAYEAMFGMPACDEETATDETVLEYTTVINDLITIRLDRELEST